MNTSDHLKDISPRNVQFIVTLDIDGQSPFIRTFNSLLDALEWRKTLLTTLQPWAAPMVVVWQNDGMQWVAHDTVRFMKELERLLAPAE